ncbi:MAG TPA: hypothetical protein VNE16_11765 [Vicinamibacterales bacterium]|nr:hypothetical protein [Thermomicrobiaceae bacterium]HVC20748.1 hypothetical protein [Vicinamibacterales bacterium]
MMQTFDPALVESLARLLATPDPVDLPRRRHVYRCEGDPDRRATRLPGLLMAWLQWRYLENDVEELPVPATTSSKACRRPANPGLRVLRHRTAG